jgi:hypothetical protein
LHAQLLEFVQGCLKVFEFSILEKAQNHSSKLVSGEKVAGTVSVLEHDAGLTSHVARCELSTSILGESSSINIIQAIAEFWFGCRCKASVYDCDWILFHPQWAHTDASLACFLDGSRS